MAGTVDATSPSPESLHKATNQILISGLEEVKTS